MQPPDETAFAQARRNGQSARAAGDHAGALAAFRAAGALDPADPWSRNDAALALLALDRPGEAEAEASSLAQAVPDFAPAHRTLGLIARARARHEAALDHFRAAARLDPRDLWNRHDAAAALRALGRLDEADAAYRAVAAGTPLAHSLRGMGLAARARGDHAHALDCLRAAVLLMPGDAWFALDAALTLKALGRTDEADAELGRIASAHPDFTQAFVERAALAQARGDADAARGHIEAAIAIAPDDPALRSALAEAQLRLGDAIGAETLFARLLVAHPRHLGAYRGLARIARARSDHRTALAHLSAAARIRPDDAGIEAERAGELLNLGRTAEAEAAARSALDLEPENAGAQRALALAFKAGGKIEAALALGRERWRDGAGEAQAGLDLAGDLREAGHIEEALALYERLADDPLHGITALLEGAACLRRSQGAPAAHRLVEAALARDPAHPRALLLAGDAARETGNVAGAEIFYDRALAARPGFYWALCGKAANALRGGDGAAARRHFEAAIEADPLEGHAQIELAMDLDDCGERDAARALLDSIPAASPRLAQASMARGRLHRLEGDWAGAASAFAKAAAHPSVGVEALIEQSEDEARDGRGSQAAETLERAMRLAPDHPAVLDAMARRAMVLDDPTEALALSARALEAEPSRLQTHLSLARARAALGRGEEALSDLDRAGARFGARPEIAIARAELLRRGGDVPAARTVLEGVMRSAPDHPGLWLHVAQAEIEAGRFEGAAAAIRGAPKRTASEIGRVRFALSLLAAARWDLKSAIEQGEAAVAALPGDGWVRNRLIHAALLDLDLDRAGRHLRELASLEAAANRLRGKSTNPSQSHYGQILDEFRMDGEALGVLKAACARPAGERIAGLLECVATYRDSTVAAIRLFIELRRDGRLDAAHSQSEAIPRAIHQYWDEERPPADVAGYLQSWPAHHPGFSHTLWSHRTARDFLRERGLAAALVAYERASEPAMKADLFRLALLYEVGGIYADADDRCLESLEPLLATSPGMMVYQEDLGSLGNNVIAAVPRHPVIARALALASEAVNRGDNDIVWLATGPGLLTRAAAQIAAENKGKGDLLVLDRHTLGRHVSIHCIAAYKASERHWSRTAFAGGRAAAPIRPPGTPAASPG